MMRKQFVELRMKKKQENIKKNVLQDEKHEIWDEKYYKL